MVDSEGTREPLVLRYEPVTGPVSNLFVELQQDAELQRLFVQNPAAVISRVQGRELPPQQVSEANEVLFEILGNQALLTWLQEYMAEERTLPLSRTQFIDDFGRALLTHGGDSPAAARVRDAILAGEQVTLGDSPHSFITHSEVIGSHLLFSTDQQSHSHSHTAQSVSADGHPNLLSDLRSTTNFEQHSQTTSPATSRGSGQDPIDQTLVSPEFIRGTVDALVRHAIDVRNAGLRDTPGGG
ncbi:hypothetical protein AB0M35_19690 [Micromonospora sp. NPDC051196]|uniref:hypothetical protein n=1 Tax=Micromonospora sp. NPDC051196 TaxID=3155281 RepID=UPI003425A849